MSKLNGDWSFITRGNVSYLSGQGFDLVSGANDSTGVWFNFNSILANDSVVGVNVTLSSEVKGSLSVTVFLRCEWGWCVEWLWS